MFCLHMASCPFSIKASSEAIKQNWETMASMEEKSAVAKTANQAGTCIVLLVLHCLDMKLMITLQWWKMKPIQQLLRPQ